MNIATTDPWADDQRPWVTTPRVDVNGIGWYACDPYPTWYRRVDGQIKTGSPVFPGDEL